MARTHGIKMVWEDPPARGAVGRLSYYDEVAVELKRHPGKWGVVRKGGKSSSAANSLLKRDPRFEVTTRKMDDGTVSTWACWPEIVTAEEVEVT